MRRTLWLLVLVVAAAPAAAVMPPRQGGALPGAYFAAREADATAYRLRGAWIAKTELVRAERAVFLRPLATHRGSGAVEAPSVSGTFAFPVLLGEFSNRPAGFEPSALDEKLFTGPSATGTLAEYFDEVSYGALSVTGLVADWVVTFQDDVYYEGTSNGLLPNDAKTGEFLKELLDANDGTIDFSAFDNDGPDGVPNSGDDDGFADLVVFVHSEAGGECGNASPNMWSHSWLYRGWPVSGGEPYATNDPCANGGTILIDDYSIQPGVSCAGGVIEIGGFCHETGHALGLPDLFDSDGGSSGAGHWDLMALGAWNTAASPAHLSAWSRAELGWVAPTVVTWEGSVRTIPQIETDPTCYLLPFSDDRFRRMSECAIAGSYSLRCGLDAAEAAARGWEGGSGYGNGWMETVERGFDYDGSTPVVLSFAYAHDLEPETDSAGVFLDIGGTRTALASYTGVGSGTETIDISSHLGVLAAPAAYTIEFVVKTDAAWSDEDGKNLTDCGAFVIDDMSVTGGGENYATGFESSADGWGQNLDDNPPAEYWLVENRQPVGFDQHLHNSGLLVWHVDEEVIRSSLGNTGGAGNTAVHGLVLEEADGMGQLLQDPLTTGNAGDPGDPFPGVSGSTGFDASSTPSSASNTGPPTEIEVSSIGPSGPTMTAFLRAGDPAPLVTAVAPGIVDNDRVSVGIGVDGDRIRPGATLRFVRTGEPVIAPMSVYWRDSGVLDGIYNVYSRKGGAWDVVVENPDGQTGVLAGGLNIVQMVAAQLQAARIGVTGDGTIELVFELYGVEADESLVVSRADGASGPWERLQAEAERFGERGYRFVDAAVEPGRIYFYRLEVWSSAGDTRELYRGEVETPAAGFALEPCVPNPFNPSTAIRFVLPQRSNINLTVYDVTGRVVRTLAAETLPAGRHERVWDGRDNGGALAGSGVYICRLEAGSRRASVKVLLLK
jgi:M6 family metalloprotease-like protein